MRRTTRPHAWRARSDEPPAESRTHDGHRVPTEPTQDRGACDCRYRGRHRGRLDARAGVGVDTLARSTGTIVDAVWNADSDLQVRDGLATLLRTAGLDVRTFGLAEALLHALRQEQPACIVLDIDLPDLSGLEVLLRIRGRRPELPIIMLAACADVSLAVCSLHLGAMDFIEKPFVCVVVLARVREAVGRGARDAGVRPA